MRVVFLDFDGPIIPLMSHRPARPLENKAWPACVRALNRITDSTGAKIVVSSTWRWGGEVSVVDLLKKWGVTGHVIGITPILHEQERIGGLVVTVERGHEIAAWLRDHDIESFVILDDDDDMGHLKSRLIQTPFEQGLTERDADDAIRILERVRDRIAS